jgi:radical SAM protein with 4Fe4S-binding SPASM domain
MLTAAGISVSVRLNVDERNIHEMSQLVSLLNQHFGVNDHLSIYSHELYGEDAIKDRVAFYEQRMLLEKEIENNGYKQRYRLQKDIKLNHCMADNDQNVVISPEGYLGKCEHYIDREFFGHIESKERDEDIIRRFKERPEDIEACATCAYYPQCFRLIMCENGVVCTPERQKEHIHDMLEAMKEEYQNYLNHKEHETEL